MIILYKQISYALQFLIALKQLSSKRVLSLKQFSSQTGISFLFLQKIAKKLKSAGIITSCKGRSGGYVLNVKANQLSLYDIIKVFAGQTAIVPCVFNSKACKVTNCRNFKIMQLNNKIIGLLENSYLSDF